MAHYLNDDLEFVNDGYFDFVEFDDEGFEIDYEEEGHDADLDGLGSPECKQVERKSTFYDFQFNTRLVKSTIAHFQLRNLLWATSKHDVYMMQNYSIMHWSSLLRRSKEVLNVAGQIVPTQKPRGSSAQSLSRVQISTMAVKDNFIVAGGFHGELICKYINQPGVTFCTNVTDSDNAITNAVDIYQPSNGSMRVMTANNDCHVRVFDTERYALLNRFSFPWSVNVSIMHHLVPMANFLSVLGDTTDCLIGDPVSGKVIGTLQGHLDYSFASAWHPDGRILATGNQDTTCRLWDIRNLSQSMAVLKGRMGAIRGLKFSLDGRFMAMAEPADFVHIYETAADYSSAQEIDLFGEIAGISFSPDAESLFVGIADRTYGSLLEFSRRRRYDYLESFL
ncbi:putative WD repeat-containing protein [Ananas comosus]|uniref:Putative WD repeat-containing protein n=1 Tax=Ananas comosus TaxID=4615 RepID=A0A199V2W5_ANACO|nr:putative WD repeat-containing protein [Ananas comosus]